MTKRWYSALIVVVLFHGCATDHASKPSATDLTTVTLEQTLHFQSADGSDTVLAPGDYRLAHAGADGLLFQTSDGRTVPVGARAFPHDLPVRNQVAMLIPQGEDDWHVVLLLENGSGLDALGSPSAVRSRATLEPIQSTKLLLAAQAQPKMQAIGVVDPCGIVTPASSASSQLPTSVSAITQAGHETIAQTGSGPVPDITDWIPRGRVAGGSEIRIQGRNLDPNKLVVLWGGAALSRTGQSPGEVRFRVPASVDLAGRKLVAYHIGGQPRTLEPAYQVFDPVVRISRVVPAAFKEGDVVTVCGNSLFNATFITPSTSLQPQYVGVGDKAAEIMEPAVSPSGDRMSFRVLRAAELFVVSSDPSFGYTWSLRAVQPQPSALNGPFKLKKAGSAAGGFSNPLQDTTIISGPAVSWQPAPLHVRTAYNSSRFSSLKVPFVIVTGGASGPILRQVSFEGTGLAGAAVRIGDMALQPSIPTTGLQGAAVIPTNASNGRICATKDNQTSCSPEVIKILGGPTVMQMPSVPLAMFVTHSIEGVNLAPAGVTGLTYEFRMSGSRADNPSAQACNTVMQLVEHSQQRIRFRVGDPSKPVPANCLSTTIFNTSGTQFLMQLVAKYSGIESILWEQPYGLKKPT